MAEAAVSKIVNGVGSSPTAPTMKQASDDQPRDIGRSLAIAEKAFMVYRECILEEPIGIKRGKDYCHDCPISLDVCKLLDGVMMFDSEMTRQKCLVADEYCDKCQGRFTCWTER